MGGAGAVGIAGLAGCLGGDDDSDSADDADSSDDASTDGDLADSLVVQVVGGHYIDSYQEEVFSGFEEEYGVDVEVHQISDQFDGYTQIQTGQSDADVSITSANTLYMGANQDVWEPIDTSALENYDSLLETFENPIYDAGSEVHGIPTVYGTVGMAYNRDELGELDSWEACWDEANDGRITMQGTDFVRVFTTALYLGMDPNDIQVDDSYEDGIEQIWDSVREQQDLVSNYWTTGDEHVRMYSEGEAYVGEAWGGRIKAAVEDGHDHLDYVVPQEGAYSWSDNWVMVSGIDDATRRTAMAYFDYLLSEDVIVPLAEALGYPPATDATSDVIEDLYDYDPSGGERLTFLEPGYEDEHSDEWSEEWESIQSA
ncbi:PotD/PotF family extracellular solute-binding protein [Natrialba sp. INN-245]|uniref:ABC transporter substrate-binding protein n=1 Tax=Natrialba sp. INN-245 TaxID=2690967 RepID=UPI0013124861|nr:PotD/PotF family extracellular solute-binding protein [Natrialba sp. INN-245]MWV39815.1 extracellular solute-binding protein [Natrialba sp. INN-245]